MESQTVTAMIRDYPVYSSLLWVCMCFIIISISIGVTQTCYAASEAVLRPEMKAIYSNHVDAKHSQSFESVISAIIDPKVLLASATDQIRNQTNKYPTYSQNSSALRSVSTTVLLSHQILPPNDFVSVYNSAPYTIAKAYLTAKLPCDSTYHSQAYVLFGKLSKLKLAALVPLKKLSIPGYLCMYNSYLSSSEFVSKGTNGGVTDIVLFNPTYHRIVLLNTSTIILNVNDNMPHSKTSNY